MLDRCGAAALIITLLLSATPIAASASTPSTTSTVLSVGNGVGVISTYAESTGCSEVFLSDDLSHWHNVTPSLEPRSAQCDYAWASASFVSPLDGWLLARNGGGTGTVLEHTVNGGRTWAQQPGGDTGSNGGWESIDFTSVALGWRQQFADGSNAAFVLQRTLDGGSTWTNVVRAPGRNNGCEFLPDVFATASIGFAALPLGGTTAGSALNLPYVWRTLDGGVHWSKMTLPRPSSVPPSAPAVYGQPTFLGRSGSLVVDFAVDHRQRVTFYTTSDAGRRWSLVSNGHVPLLLKGAVAIDDDSAGGWCGDFASTVQGPLAVVDPVSPSTWWIVRPGPKGNTLSTVINLAKKSVTTKATTDLPSTFGETTLRALNSKDALLAPPPVNGVQTVFSTIDAGSTWTKVTPSVGTVGSA